MNHTHDLAEWAAFLLLGVGVHASFSVVWFVTVDAHRSDFDPRPVVQRVLASGTYRVRLAVWDVTRSKALYPLLREWDNAPHDARELASVVALDVRLTAREAALTAAALLALLLPAPEGATR